MSVRKKTISKSKDFSNGEEVAIEITAKVINDNEKKRSGSARRP